jgi:protein-disulfide isomerase
MGLTDMKCLRSLVVAIATTLSVAALSAFGPAPLFGQRSAPPGTGDSFKDASTFRPPAGARVAIIEFQDLQCPACAHAFPIVHKAVSHYNIALIEKDFPLPQHVVLGSTDGAVWARYLQDKVSMKVADDYRGAVFAAQTGIQNKDDMLNFTRRFFQSHGLQMPFVADPSGELLKAVQADKALGEKIGVQHTPTIVVCSQHEWVNVTDISLLYQTIDEVEAKAGTAMAVKAPVAKKTTH